MLSYKPAHLHLGDFGGDWGGCWVPAKLGIDLCGLAGLPVAADPVLGGLQGLPGIPEELAHVENGGLRRLRKGKSK